MNNPMLEESSIKGATHILVNIVAGEDFSPPEYQDVVNLVKETADPDVMIKPGFVSDESMGDSVQVTVVATGFEDETMRLANAEKEKEKAAPRNDLLFADEWDNITGVQQGPARERNVFNSFREPDLEVPTVLRSGRMTLASDVAQFRKQA
jgi:hypothetical protein